MALWDCRESYALPDWIYRESRQNLVLKLLSTVKAFSGPGILFAFGESNVPGFLHPFCTKPAVTAATIDTTAIEESITYRGSILVRNSSPPLRTNLH